MDHRPLILLLLHALVMDARRVVPVYYFECEVACVDVVVEGGTIDGVVVVDDDWVALGRMDVVE